MTIKHDVDKFIEGCGYSPAVGDIKVDCTVRGGNRIFGGSEYRGYKLQFIGQSKEKKRRAERQRIEKFKASQHDAFETKPMG